MVVARTPRLYIEQQRALALYGVADFPQAFLCADADGETMVATYPVAIDPDRDVMLGYFRDAVDDSTAYIRVVTPSLHLVDFFNQSGGFRYDRTDPVNPIVQVLDSTGNLALPAVRSATTGRLCEQVAIDYQTCLAINEIWRSQADDVIATLVPAGAVGSCRQLTVQMQGICAGIVWAGAGAIDLLLRSHVTDCTSVLNPGDGYCPAPAGSSPECVTSPVCHLDGGQALPYCVYPPLPVGSCSSGQACGGPGFCDSGACRASEEAETCDNYDNDCDLVVDDFPTSCGVGACASTGACSTGIDSCTSGAPAANDATCNGIDDDCDGITDEDYVPGVTSCGVGACAAAGQFVCVAGMPENTCAPGTPTTETCNGLDDDCNGTADEGCTAQCLEVNGAGWVEAPDSTTLDVSGDITLESWVYIRSTSTYFPAVTKWRDGGISHRAYFLAARDHPSTSAPRFAWSNNGGDCCHQVIGPSAISRDQWHHVAAVRRGQQMSLFVDGELAASSQGPTSGIFNGPEPLRIGRGLLYDWDVYGIGLLDDVRVWNVARSQAEIQASLFGLVGFVSGLVGHWTFDEPSGAALDSSGNGNTGAFNGDAARVACSRPLSDGCSDGTRDGFGDHVAYPNVAACAGSWTGPISGESATALCTPGWHVCNPDALPEDRSVLGTVTYGAAVAITGCFAYNAAQDNDTCVACTGAYAFDDMAGVGANCAAGHYSPNGTGCMGTGRLDADCCSAFVTDHACKQNTSNPHIGVVCCRD